MSPGSGARLRASIATYSARVPSRCQSARPNTRCPTDTPVVPYPRALTTPASSCPGIDGRRSRSRRSVQVEGHAVSVGTNPDAWISTMTSLIAAGGSGRSTSVIPAGPEASSVTTIAFICDLPVVVRLYLLRTADRDRHHFRSFPHRRTFPTASYAGDPERPRPRPRRGVLCEPFRVWGRAHVALCLVARVRLGSAAAAYQSARQGGLRCETFSSGCQHGRSRTPRHRDPGRARLRARGAVADGRR